MINPANYNSYQQLANAVYKYSETARKELAKKLLFRMVSADIAGRKEQQHFASKKKLRLASPLFWEALKEFLGKIVVTAEQLSQIEAKYKRLVFGTKSLMGIDDALQYTILSRARALIGDAINGNKTYDDFRREMQDVSTIPESRLKLIFNQNILQAYNAGAWQQLYEQMPTDEYLVYDTAHDERVDDICEQFDNFVALKSDPQWDIIWPPIHFGCRCTVRMALDSDMEAAITDINPDVIPEDFQTSPRDGFTLSLPTADDLESMRGYFDSVGVDTSAIPDMGTAQGLEQP